MVAPLPRVEVVGHPAAARVSSLGCLALESLKAASEGTWCARRQMALELSGCAAWLLAGLFPHFATHRQLSAGRVCPCFVGLSLIWSVKVDVLLDSWFGRLLSGGEGGG